MFASPGKVRAAMRLDASYFGAAAAKL